ncbi:DUF5131 family protein [Leptobacterium sp. I13]|uniref:DUF5131 family protein n=1 Tax=Leptobacterium meishanense TaxID=3128904 RepID=UPI0030EE46A6
MRDYSKTKINWSDFTWNPWWGCNHVSDECFFCYIDEIMKKLGYDPKKVNRTKPHTFNKPLKLKEPSIIFTCSMSDFFHKQADQWRSEAWDIIKKTPHHTYLILTKRPERILESLPEDWGDGYPNVWLGVSVGSNEPKSIKRIDIIKLIPAKIRFISFEPLIEDIKISPKKLEGIHWAIIGGESGKVKDGKPQYREAKPEWFRNLRDICKEAGVLVWFKQAGTFLARKHKMYGKGEALHQIPKDLQLRERPDLIGV